MLYRESSVTAVANLLAGVLLLLAFVHVLWGLGVVWPAKNEQALADAVVGFKLADQMPPAAACFVVAVALLGGAAVAYLLKSASGPIPQPFLAIAGTLLSAVFLTRGVATYTTFWRNLTPRQPFVRLDTALYGPLCLCLGAGFAVLVADSLHS